MSARLTSDFLAGALVRRVQADGGFAAVLARGDSTSGAILILTLDRGQNPQFFERMPSLDGGSMLAPSGPKTLNRESEATAYWQSRRERDRDLWVIELDIAGAERLAATVFDEG